jgi:hypothetical protein
VSRRKEKAHKLDFTGRATAFWVVTLGKDPGTLGRKRRKSNVF